MPIDFPNSPSVNDTFSSGGSTWIWTGTVWNTVTTAVGATGPTGPTGATGATGPTGPSAITTEGDLAVGGEAGVPTRLPIGTNGQVLSSNGTTAVWSTPATPATTTNWTTLVNGSAIPTGASTSTISFIEGYDKYFITGRMRSSSTASFYFNLRDGDNTNFSTNFSVYTVIDMNSNIGTTNGSFNVELDAGSTNNSGQFVNFAMMISGASQAGTMTCEWNSGAESSGSGHTSYVGKAWLTIPSTKALGQIHLRTTVGTFNSGFVYVYGA